MCSHVPFNLVSKCIIYVSVVATLVMFLIIQFNPRAADYLHVINRTRTFTPLYVSRFPNSVALLS